MAVLLISPINASPEVQTLGGAFYISCETRAVTAPYALTSAGTSTKITIRDPRGAVAVSAAAMTASAVGVFYYVYSTALTDQPGKYTVEITTLDGGVSSIGRFDFLFELVLSS